MADLVLDLRGQRELSLQRRRAQDPVALGEHAHQLRVRVHLDELRQPRAVLVRHPVARLDERRRTGRARGTPRCGSSTARCYRTIGSIVHMATRRDELVAAAARLFAERGYHGTSMADLAEAMGVQKGSLYSLTESKQELLVDVTREGAAAFHAALDARAGRRRAARAGPRGAARPPRRRRRAARRRDGVHARVAVPRRAGADGVPGASVAATRSAGATSSARLPSAARCAPTSTWRRPSCSSSRPRTGRTPGCGPEPTRTRSPTGSSRSSSTACAATPRATPARRVPDAVAHGWPPDRQPPGERRLGRARRARARGAAAPERGRRSPSAAGRGRGDRASEHEASVDAIYVFAGDGTYNEVLNGVRPRPARVRPGRRHERAAARARAAARPVVAARPRRAGGTGRSGSAG